MPGLLRCSRGHAQGQGKSKGACPGKAPGQAPWWCTSVLMALCFNHHACAGHGVPDGILQSAAGDGCTGLEVDVGIVCHRDAWGPCTMSSDAPLPVARMDISVFPGKGDHFLVDINIAQGQPLAHDRWDVSRGPQTRGRRARARHIVAQGLRHLRGQRPGRVLLPGGERQAPTNAELATSVGAWGPTSASPPTATRAVRAYCPAWARPLTTPRPQARPRRTRHGQRPAPASQAFPGPFRGHVHQVAAPLTWPGSGGPNRPSSGATSTSGQPRSPCRSPSGGGEQRDAMSTVV